jgi:hypothetical protein
MEIEKEKGMKDLIEAAEAMVATAFGNTDGLTEAEQIEAMKMAAEALDEALGEALKAFKGEAGQE